MADINIYLNAPIPGESPYVDVLTEWQAGNEDIFIHAGKEDTQIPAHWRLVAGIHLLTCSADVQDRKFYETLFRNFDQETAVQLWGLISSNAITAGQTGGCVYSSVGSVVNFNGYAGINVTQLIRLSGMEDQFLIKDTDYMQFVISNGHANDTHRLALTFKYLNYGMGIDKRC